MKRDCQRSRSDLPRGRSHQTKHASADAGALVMKLNNCRVGEISSAGNARRGETAADSGARQIQVQWNPYTESHRGRSQDIDRHCSSAHCRSRTRACCEETSDLGDERRAVRGGERAIADERWRIVELRSQSLGIERSPWHSPPIARRCAAASERIARSVICKASNPAGHNDTEMAVSLPKSFGRKYAGRRGNVHVHRRRNAGGGIRATGHAAASRIFSCRS